MLFGVIGDSAEQVKHYVAVVFVDHEHYTCDNECSGRDKQSSAEKSEENSEESSHMALQLMIVINDRDSWFAVSV
jgi:hypothetical protein